MMDVVRPAFGGPIMEVNGMLVKVAGVNGKTEVLGIGNIERVVLREGGTTSIVFLSSGNTAEVVGTPEEVHGACSQSMREVAVIAAAAAAEASVAITQKLREQLGDG
jgi:hypothetical protein